MDFSGGRRVRSVVLAGNFSGRGSVKRMRKE